MNTSLIDTLDTLLPQTQCTRCGYPDCRAYAVAMATDRAPVNRCPPGGQATISRLADTLGAAITPLDPSCGQEGPPTTAVIDESRCIGCTLCIQACPVDAIVGSAKRMHTVLTGSCSGCDLCLAPCPVDCIDMVPLAKLAHAGHAEASHLLERDQFARAQMWRSRYRARKLRQDRSGNERPRHPISGIDGRSQAQAAGSGDHPGKQAIIAAALERARIRRARYHGNSCRESEQAATDTCAPANDERR